VFEYSNRDFFECQNIVETCWFEAFFTKFREAFEGQKLEGPRMFLGVRGQW